VNKEGLLEVIRESSFLTGLPISAEGAFSIASQSIKFRVQGLNDLETFYFLAHRSPMSWILELKFDTFAKHLIDWLASIQDSNWLDFKNELNDLPRNKLNIESNVDCFLNPEIDSKNQNEVFKLVIVSQPPLDWNQIPLYREISILSDCVSNAFLLVDRLFKGSFDSSPEGFVPDIEGIKNFSTCSTYSRSPKNRKKCLDIFGFVCAACGLDPELQYGTEGKYIIHVHHVTPVSEMNEPAPLNVETDLVPLCPNCHNFAHKFVPPKSVSEIRKMFGRTLPNKTEL
jgi:hypothetical protein